MIESHASQISGLAPCDGCSWIRAYSLLALPARLDNNIRKPSSSSMCRTSIQSMTSAAFLGGLVNSL
jgi:hypothetical protein